MNASSSSFSMTDCIHPGASASAWISPAPVGLRVDARITDSVNDRFVTLATSPTPRLSWVVPLVRVGQIQCAYEVRLLSIEKTPVAADAMTVWASGTVESADSWVRITNPLPANSLFHVTVRTRDEHDTWSEWASTVPVETGPHTLADWGASWVSHPALHTLRRSFPLESPCFRARLHVTAQGLVRATVNGHPVNNESSDLSRTGIVRSLYRSYDISELLTVGENHLDLDLARGDWKRSGLEPRVLATMVVDLRDGSRVQFGTGENLLVAPSEVIIEEPFYLESHDFTQDKQEFIPSALLATLKPHPLPSGPETSPTRVEVDPGPPIRGTQTFKPHEVPAQKLNAASDATVSVSTSATPRVWDLGVNIAGRTRLILQSPVPTDSVIRVVHGEHLRDDGHVDTTNLSMPYDYGRVRQVVEYIVPKTSAVNSLELEPWFCFHGFRYIEVLGLPPDSEVEVQGIALHSELPLISTLETDDSQVNTLTAAAKRTLLNNVHGIPEDCPTREQSGWTGDTASVTEFQYSAFDMQAFFTKWIDDLLTSQQPEGWIPAIAPDIRPVETLADPVWGAALQRVLMGYWLHYGDADLIRKCLPALRRWVDFQLDCRTPNGIIGASPISYGHDWLALEQTPPELHHTGATIDSLAVLAVLESAVGDAAAAAERTEQAQELRQAARHAFVDPATAIVGNGSQASYAIALESGWLSETETALAAERLEAGVRANGNRVSSGFAATRTVARALAHNGRSNIILDTLHQKDEPGVGAMLTLGNGTFWECWWIDPKNTGTGSLDHIGLGGPFAAWAWQSLAGVRPVSAGYSQFVVEPHLVEGINSLSVETETIRGTVGMSYEREGNAIMLTVRVPVGSNAQIRMPAGGEHFVGAGEHTLHGLCHMEQSASQSAPSAASPVIDQPASWRPPTWAPISADVDGRADLLTQAAEAEKVVAVNDIEHFQVISENLHCMPIPHAQIHGPLVYVQGREPASDGTTATTSTPMVAATFSRPLDLKGASFIYGLWAIHLSRLSSTA